MSHDYEARPVVLDIDGTVCQNGHRIDYQNPISVRQFCRAIPSAQGRVYSMRKDGWNPFFLSFRDEMVLSSTTMAQIREWFGDDVAEATELFLVKPAGLNAASGAEFREIMVYAKAKALRDIADLHDGRVGVMVGDTEMDRAAAKLAGWRFMHAVDWRAGARFSLNGEAQAGAEPSLAGLGSQELAAQAEVVSNGQTREAMHGGQIAGEPIKGTSPRQNGPETSQEPSQ